MKTVVGISLFVLLVLLASRASAWPQHGGFRHGFPHHGFPDHRFPHQVAPHFPRRPFIITRPWPGPAYWWGPGWGFAYGSPYPFYDSFYYDSFYGYYDGFYPPSRPAPWVLQPRGSYFAEGGSEPPATRSAQGDWYYCTSARQYYPNVKTCPEPWVEVPPTPPGS
jgi:hypothetical protein